LLEILLADAQGGIIAGRAGREAIVVICLDKLDSPTPGEQRIAEVTARIQAILADDQP
jgi:hypothetical protein